MPGVTHLAREHSTHQNLSEKTNTKTGTGQSDSEWEHRVVRVLYPRVPRVRQQVAVRRKELCILTASQSVNNPEP